MKIFQIFLTTILFILFFMGYSGTADLLLILGYSGLILITIGIENKPTLEDPNSGVEFLLMGAVCFLGFLGVITFL